MNDPHTIQTNLNDINGENPPLPCRICVTTAGIEIQPEGYGDYWSDNGKGSPILIEFYEGKLRVVIWDDINKEDATHVIELEGAREILRQPVE